MAEEKVKMFVESSDDVDAAAYLANYGAHRVGISKDESRDYYTYWAESGGYEKASILYYNKKYTGVQKWGIFH